MLLNIPQKPGKIIKERKIDALQMEELVLNNGMKVCLKPTPNSEEEIQLNAFAQGGWLAFPENQKVSAKYAGTIAFESGLGEIHYRDLEKLMFKYSLELSIRTYFYHRSIEASCPTSSIEHLLAIIHNFFIKPRYHEKGLERVIEKTFDAMLHRKGDCDTNFEDLFNAINSQHHEILKPITENELRKVDFQKSQEIFEISFSSPEEFVFVIVGNFNIDMIKPLILHYLGSIPPKRPSPIWGNREIQLPFPPGIIKKEIKCDRNMVGLTRLTFPLSSSINTDSLQMLEFMTQIIETRLRNYLRNKMGSNQAVDVGYVFPLFPRFQPAWLTLQFRSSPKQVGYISSVILEEIENLRQKGPSEGELKSVKSLFNRMNTFWKREANYWLAMLSNYYQWRRDPEMITKDQEQFQHFTHEETKELLSHAFPTNNYTLIMIH